MKTRILLISTACLATGCAADPSVRPVLVRQLNDLPAGGHETYALQESSVVLDSTTTGEGANRRTNISSKYVRSEQPNVRVALVPDNSPGVRTDITIERFENTDLPKKIEVNVVDNRVQLIGQVGQVVTSAITTLVGFSANRAQLRLPYRVNVSEVLRERTATTAANTYSHPNDHLTIRFGPLGPDSIPVNSMPSGSAGPWFYYAACRTALIEFVVNNQSYSVTHRVSDPHFLQRVRLPVKGAVTMHSECGASVTGTMENDDASSVAAITAALIAQAQAIQQAAEGEEED